jgi:SagB-type dehydrogenase family enzyme
VSGYSAQLLHESTKHGTPPPDPARLVAYQRLDPGNAPSPFKGYQGLETLPLPRRLVESPLPATAVLSGERGETRPLDSTLLSTLLFLGAGVTRMAGPSGHRTYFRTAMSAGNLHPIEVYLVTGDLDGVGAGVYHYSPLEVALTRLRTGDLRAHLGTTSPLAVVLTGIPWRTTWKYGERGWRHLYWDSGTMLANMLAVADAHGLESRTVVGFDDDRVVGLLGIDGVSEMPLVVVHLGPGDPVEPSAERPDPLSPEVAPLAPRPIRLPLLQEAQEGGKLSAGEVDRWRQAKPELARNAPARVAPPQEVQPEPIEEVILRRGSTRRMRREPVGHRDLEWPMAAATRRVGLDVAPAGTLLDNFVNVHAVEGLEPGAYRHTSSSLELIGQVESLRRVSAELCLGQALGGDSAYTVFHCAELDPIFASLGSRGYRAAQLEAGVVSGRLALCAFALELGATGLTFFDDAVSRFLGTRAQPMLVTSVGVPVGDAAPAGFPGQPVELSR